MIEMNNSAMKRVLLIAVVLSLLTGCDSGVGTEGPAEAIKTGFIDLSADTDRAYLDRTITITTRFLPGVKGKGHIGIKGIGEWGDNYGWILNFPYGDTMRPPGSRHEFTVVPFECDPARASEQEWAIRLLPQGPEGVGEYYFTAHATMDSIFIADSNRYFSFGSSEVQRSSPHGWGYMQGANERRVLIFRKQ